MSAVTSHVLDTSTGRPAAGVAVVLESVAAAVEVIASGVTDTNGRVSDLGPAELPAGTYRLVFATGEYYAAMGVETFFPQIEIVFTVRDPAEHYHVPALLSPFAYSTYRGS
jgi:5-hydroxyisourate hydrolase